MSKSVDVENLSEISQLLSKLSQNPQKMADIKNLSEIYQTSSKLSQRCQKVANITFLGFLAENFEF